MAVIKASHRVTTIAIVVDLKVCRDLEIETTILKGPEMVQSASEVGASQ